MAEVTSVYPPAQSDTGPKVLTFGLGVHTPIPGPARSAFCGPVGFICSRMSHQQDHRACARVSGCRRSRTALGSALLNQHLIVGIAQRGPTGKHARPAFRPPLHGRLSLPIFAPSSLNKTPHECLGWRAFPSSFRMLFQVLHTASKTVSRKTKRNKTSSA